MNKFISVLFIALMFCVFAVPAQAVVTLGFYGISANDSTDVTTGEAQLSVDVIAVGSSQVKFTFKNSGPDASSITDVYFDDGSLLGIASLIQISGVAFTQLADP